MFVSGRLEHLRSQTIMNLNFYGVYIFELYLAKTENSKLDKTRVIDQLGKKYNIVAVLNDQNDSPHLNLVKFPKLYTV